MKKLFCVTFAVLLFTAVVFGSTLEDVKSFVSQNKLSDAAAACNNILAQKPGNVNALRWLAYCEYRLGNFDKVIELNKNNKLKDAEFSNYVALAYVAKKDNQNAEKEFNNAIVYDKKYISSYINKALYYMDNKDFSNAKTYLVMANNIDGKNPKILTNLGVANIELGQYGNAVSNFTKAKDINSKDRTVLMNLACAYTLNKEYAKAFKEYESLNKLYPNDNEISLGLANSYAALNNLDKAENIYVSYLKNNPNDFNANYNMGMLQKKKNKFSEAVKYFTKASEINANDTDVLKENGWCLFKSGNSKAAQEKLAKVLEKNQDDVSALYYMGAINLNNKNYNEAYNNWSRCVILAPKNADYKINLGNVCNELGKYDEAVSLYKNALNINSKSENAQFGLGSAKLQKALSEKTLNKTLIGESLNIFKQITDNDPKNSKAWINLGICYQKTNKNTEAMNCYKKALALNPKSEEAKSNIAELSKAVN